MHYSLQRGNTLTKPLETGEAASSCCALGVFVQLHGQISRRLYGSFGHKYWSIAGCKLEGREKPSHIQVVNRLIGVGRQAQGYWGTRKVADSNAASGEIPALDQRRSLARLIGKTNSTSTVVLLAAPSRSARILCDSMSIAAEPRYSCHDRLRSCPGSVFQHPKLYGGFVAETTTKLRAKFILPQFTGAIRKSCSMSGISESLLRLCYQSVLAAAYCKAYLSGVSS